MKNCRRCNESPFDLEETTYLIKNKIKVPNSNATIHSPSYYGLQNESPIFQLNETKLYET